MFVVRRAINVRVRRAGNVTGRRAGNVTVRRAPNVRVQEVGRVRVRCLCRDIVDPVHLVDDATTRFWRAWLGRAHLPDHRWRDPIQRSALTIKGLTYMPTGATVAALTTWQVDGARREKARQCVE